MNVLKMDLSFSKCTTSIRWMNNLTSFYESNMKLGRVQKWNGHKQYPHAHVYIYINMCVYTHTHTHIYMYTPACV